MQFVKCRSPCIINDFILKLLVGVLFKYRISCFYIFIPKNRFNRCWNHILYWNWLIFLNEVVSCLLVRKHIFSSKKSFINQFWQFAYFLLVLWLQYSFMFNFQDFSFKSFNVKLHLANWGIHLIKLES